MKFTAIEEEVKQLSRLATLQEILKEIKEAQKRGACTNNTRITLLLAHLGHYNVDSLMSDILTELCELKKEKLLEIGDYSI